MGSSPRVYVVSSPHLEAEFPGLRLTRYQVTSPRTPLYNCIAWAAGDQKRWWWPTPPNFWPPGAPSELTLDAFIAAYATVGFSPCGDDALEDGVDKVAIFVSPHGEPTHAARQLANGRWTSKLGKAEDIEHALHGVAGATYGRVGAILRRKAP